MHCTHRLLTGLLTASAIILALQSHPASAASDPSKIGVALQAEYDNMNASMSHGDLRHYLSYHTADYSEVDPQGHHSQYHGRKQDRAQAIHAIQWVKHWNAANTVPFYYRDTIKSLRMTGEGIVVTAEEHSSIQAPLVEQEKDLWGQQAGHWRMKQRQHGEMHIIDGPPPQPDATPVRVNSPATL